MEAGETNTCVSRREHNQHLIIVQKYSRNKAPSDHEDLLHKAIFNPSVPKPGWGGGTVTSSKPCRPGAFTTCCLLSS